MNFWRFLDFFKRKQKPRKFWVETDYGLAPHFAVTKNTRRGNEGYGGFPGSGAPVGLSQAFRPLAKLKRIEDGSIEMKAFLRAQCSSCERVYVIPDFNKPPIFRCTECFPHFKNTIFDLLLVNPNDRSFSRCPGCSSFEFLQLEINKNEVALSCPACDHRSSVSREGELVFEEYSNDQRLVWCPNCTKLFTLKKDESVGIIQCTHTRCRVKGTIFRQEAGDEDLGSREEPEPAKRPVSDADDVPKPENDE